MAREFRVLRTHLQGVCDYLVLHVQGYTCQSMFPVSQLCWYLEA